MAKAPARRTGRGSPRRRRGQHLAPLRHVHCFNSRSTLALMASSMAATYTSKREPPRRRSRRRRPAGILHSPIVSCNRRAAATLEGSNVEVARLWMVEDDGRGALLGPELPFLAELDAYS